MSYSLKVKLYVKDSIFAEADYIKMESSNSTFDKKFTLSNIKFINKIEVFDYESIRIEVLCGSPRYTETPWFVFEVLLHNYKEISVNTNDLWIEGRVIPVIFSKEKDYEGLNYHYKQGVIDTFFSWQRGKEVNWNDLSGNTEHKIHYKSACLWCNGISTDMIEKSTYEFDMTYIKEEVDFSYYAAEAFIGKRGYLGRYLDTFDDCLLSIYHERGYFGRDKTIIFRNANKIIENQTQTLFEDIKKILFKYKFNIKVIE